VRTQKKFPKKKAKKKKKSKKQSKVLADTQKWVKNLGFSFPEKPPFPIPDVPKDVTKLASARLGKDHGNLAAWLDYAESEASKVAIELSNLRLKEGHVRRTVEVRDGEKYAQWKVNARVAKAVQVKGLDKEGLELEAMQKALQAIASGLEKKFKALSREITRRENEQWKSRTD
jgi:hypothetical protein